MTLELYQEVALTRDLPEYQLKAGDIATLVDFVPHPSGGEEGCLLEVFNAVGESLTVIAVPNLYLLKFTENLQTRLEELAEIKKANLLTSTSFCRCSGESCSSIF